ncbi:hypothetical protein [Paenibacillus agaridevorans]|nr:hypothetical protein [Paenibacillus agaridevorans]
MMLTMVVRDIMTRGPFAVVRDIMTRGPFAVRSRHHDSRPVCGPFATS